MNHAITHVAIDDSARKLTVAVLEAGASDPSTFTVDNERSAVRKLVRRLRAKHGPGVVACYEAGPLGFELQRWLIEDGLPCRVAAPSKTPRRPGVRIKTDNRDAIKLVRLFRADELTWVRSPTLEEEAARDAVRYLASARQDVTRAWNRAGKFLLRHGRHYGLRGRTRRHEAWLREQSFDNPVLKDVLDMHVYEIDQAQSRLAHVEGYITALSGTEPYAERVRWLCCLRGISVVIAMVILTEIHGIERFSSPRQLMAFLGVVPSEYSTGETRRLGAITKAGSPHVRWALVQMAKALRHAPGRSRVIKARRANQPAAVVAIAERAELRGHVRYKRLRQRGKEANKVTVALAREQVGFIWAILMHRATTA